MSGGRESEDARVTALALRAGAGDRRAFEDWVRATQADVWRFVAHLSDTGLADDLTQETYARAVTALRRYEGRASARTWLLSIARRVVVDHFRASSARPQLSGQDWESAVERLTFRAGRGAGYEDVVELQLLLDNLDPERREAIVLTQVLGYSYAEAAEVCDCPVGTIRSRVARARDELLDAHTDRRGDVG
ncbi:sigma-70 family RNA polymerase sigma factor [Amycolatopsis rhabdoformis]|uniref:Sigma-70 family RNA polymerase sigma factor n=1 Tax=Amycolatopsis rhabdoformis TaxID=1448059 RepID=A0ABZ1IF06_9PSEU|nr:sigma-70 family RNA polymerase sigma factor [Amycolatopsis rhabdoformis]WSE32134.1 sigma-70 family RNA polymerase sigma factor [Amycolatopsis rhabdoformis]